MKQLTPQKMYSMAAEKAEQEAELAKAFNDPNPSSRFFELLRQRDCPHNNVEETTTVIITINVHYKCPDCGKEWTESGEY